MKDAIEIVKQALVAEFGRSNLLSRKKIEAALKREAQLPNSKDMDDCFAEEGSEESENFKKKFPCLNALIASLFDDGQEQTLTVLRSDLVFVSEECNVKVFGDNVKYYSDIAGKRRFLECMMLDCHAVYVPTWFELKGDTWRQLKVLSSYTN